jgi:alpha-galactosidase
MLICHISGGRLLRATAAVVAVVLAALGLCIGTATAARSAPSAPEAASPALTPPMGWNDWNRFGCNIDETIVRQTADALVSSGLAADGYRYVNVDDCWEAPQRTAQGELTADPAKFPSGMKALADYVHGLGLKFGLYTAAGDWTCQHRPGSGGHYATDAATFASWGVDYVKFDWCGAQGDPEQLADQFRSALDGTGRPIVLSVSRHGEGWTWRTHPAQLWRTSADIDDNWNTMLRNAEEEAGIAGAAGPGHWNDPDMLEVGNGAMTATEYRAHFSLWAVLAAPLISGTDLRGASPQTLSILGNREVIAVDQDLAGREGDRIFSDGDREVWVKPLADGGRAVVLFNRGVTARRISTTAQAVGLPSSSRYAVHDLWAHSTTYSTGSLTAFVPPHGAAMFRVEPTAPASAGAMTTLSAAPGLLPAGRAAPVEVRLETAGQQPLTGVRLALSGPAGWRITPAGHMVGAAAPGHPATAQFRVTPPAGDRNTGTPATLTAHATYQAADSHAPTSMNADDGVVVPPAAPTGDIALSHHPRLENDNGWYLPAKVDHSFGDDFCGDCTGGTLSLDGHTFATGLGTYASSQMSYYLGGNCSSLDVTVGVDDEVANMSWPLPQNPVGTATFAIYGDGHLLLGTGKMSFGDHAVHRVLDVRGVHELKLVNTSAKDGNFLDHADWAGMRATCS